MGSKLIADLLSSAQPHIPPLGFTLQAIQAGAHHSGLASSSVVADLFPSTSTIGSSLLRRFDEEHWEQYSKGSPKHTDQKQAYNEAVNALRSKLLASVPVRDKLPDVSIIVLSSTMSRVLIQVVTYRRSLLSYRQEYRRCPFPSQTPRQCCIERIVSPMRLCIRQAGQALYQYVRRWSASREREGL